ncbi:hypothetical protein [Amycolatopsis sp. NPDC057786]|uniref:hypothetical protein n=1 Tax=Amycolatopsis sp. NPDC057786 TaxID=3346250 RepID=UPI0036731F5F
MATHARLEAERHELTGGNPDGPTEAMSSEDAAAQWDAAEFDERRAMLTDALSGDTLYLDPAAKNGKRQFDPKRVRIDPHKPKRRTRGQHAA